MAFKFLGQRQLGKLPSRWVSTILMVAIMELSLLVRERYGKIYLTDTGFLLAKELFRCVEVIRERLLVMGFELTEEEATALAYTMVVNLPEHSRKRLAGRE